MIYFFGSFFLQAQPLAPKRISAAAIVMTIWDQVAEDTHTNTIISTAIKPLQKQNPLSGRVISFFAMFL